MKTKIFVRWKKRHWKTKENPGIYYLSKYKSRKKLTHEGQLEYQMELLKRQRIKQKAEVLKLRNIDLKGGYSKKIIQQIYTLIRRQTAAHSVKELFKRYTVSLNR